MDHDHMLAGANHRKSFSSQNASLGPPPPSLSQHFTQQHHPHNQRHSAQLDRHHQHLPIQPSRLHPLNLPPPPAYSLSQASPSPSPMDYSSPPPAESLPSILPPLSPPSQNDQFDKMLPSISTVTGEHAFRDKMSYDHAHHPPPSHWPPTDGPMAYRQAPPQQADSPAATMDFDGANSITSAPSPERTPDAMSASLTIDDPDVRLAAEALGDLRADFVSSPPDTIMSPPAHHLPPIITNKPKSPQSEPLFSLLTTSHPFVARTIGGASSAYGGAKNFSPRFKSGAEYVEGYLNPLAKTVGSVGRVTGVEGGVRWFLGGRRRHDAPADQDSAGSSKKRRKVAGSADTNGDGHRQVDGINGTPSPADGSSPSTPKSDRRLSTTSTVDTLPAYDEMRSPAYTESATSQKPPSSNPQSNQAWQSRLIMSTSGLSIAMSAESLRSLKYCLRWLRWSNDHMGNAINSLKAALEEYEKAEKDADESMHTTQEGENGEIIEGQARAKTPQQSRTELAAKINSLKVDILKSLQDVVNNVSKYAGGALPENARILVRRHLTSLPQRFRIATMSENTAENGDKDSDSAVLAGAQKVLVLAKEGLDMVTQVSGVLDGTIVSAEEWCERMGKRRRREKEDDEPFMLDAEPQPTVDVKMG